jgi:hypothetical protein
MTEIMELMSAVLTATSAEQQSVDEVNPTRLVTSVVVTTTLAVTFKRSACH